ncbi:MAG TPA: hypothetical protein VFX70_09040 [Mycobacteriales bacterium]|nr:hypothetical protein [Mycobacteriales bacterium]
MHLDPIRRNKCTSPPGVGGPKTSQSSQSNRFTRAAVLVLVLSAGVMTWQQFLNTYFLRQQSTLGDQVQYLLLDVMLAVPFAALAVWVADRLASRAETWPQHGTYAAVVSLLFSALVIPLVAVQAWAQTLVYTGDDHAQHEAALGSGLVGLLRYGVKYALVAEPAAFVLALLTVGLFLSPVGTRGLSDRVRRAGTVGIAAVTAIVMTSTTGSPAQAAAGSTAKPDGHSTAATSTGGCRSTSVPKRTYNVVAINVDIAIDRTGDHDPFGFMYALASKVPAIRAFEKATTGHNAEDGTIPTAPTGKVSHGLAEDPIQPLVLRARLGECVVIHFANNLVHGARGSARPIGQELMTDAAGNPVTPAVSIDPQGLAYDINDGGNSVGENPTSRMTPPGGTNTYQFYLDPLAGEGGKVFHSGGDARELTAHGLFGAIIAEQAGAEWFDTETGTDHTNDANFSSWQAMIRPASGPSFREFAIMYHSIGDENFNLRRPVDDPLKPAILPPTGDGLGAPGPMLDAGLPTDTNKDAGGSESYRPGSRAINYRSEPFWRRMQEIGNIAHPNLPASLLDPMVKSKKSLGYATYTFGDPATPMPQSYLGEPTKTRLMHPGSEQLHVHHLHGGGDRWPANPAAIDPGAFATGLQKDNFGPQNTIQLDSQTIGPDESYNLEHSCGAGGCQQAAGDFLYHCHIAQHYIAGMWGFWRVFDTRQPNVAPLPDASGPPAAVTSDQLIGKTFEGKTIVLSNPGPNQVTLADWVKGQLPPQGQHTGGVDPARPGDDDGTVMDWAVGGTPSAPVYLNEPEDTLSWANYTAPHPGTRDPIMFDPTNGRYAWPMLQPHLGDRPPFSPNGHGGTPWLGSTATTARPDGLCPTGAPLRTYNIVAVSVAVQETPKETDPNGRFFVLAADKNALLNGTKAAEPLAIRSNVGDCVAITLTNEMDTSQQLKVNMHSHFIQFDPQASDGVITGASYEQSVRTDAGTGNTTLAQAVPAGATTIPVAGTDFLRTHNGVSIAVGEGRADIEIRTVTSFDPVAGTVTLDHPLAQAHAAGEPTGTEFVQYRWYSDVDSGTVFWHDHVDAITSWAHGLFGAHIIEPKGSVYLDPSDHSKQVRSGNEVDIVNTDGSAGFGQKGSFREFMLFLSNGRRGRPELGGPPPGSNQQSLLPFNFGQECEEGNINMRAEPIGERVPRADTVDDRTSPTGTAWDGGVCRNDYLDPATGQLKSTPQTIATTDPYVFSSAKYGDPKTDLLRAYAGDPVVIRTVGTVERVEALKIQGHRFRRERFNGDGELMDAGTTGVSERFDYVLDGGAGGPKHIPGDYLYYSTRNFALESGAWGIFRVYGSRQPDLAPLPDRPAPPASGGFPRQTFTGQNPAPPGPQDDVTLNPCPSSSRTRSYDVSIFNTTIQSAPANATGPLPADDANGVIYALTSDVAGIKAGTKPLEPLVLRADIGDCVNVTLHNEITPGSLYGGTRAGFDLAKLLSNPQQSGGAAVGFNPDTTVPIGGQRTYTYYADRQLGTSIFEDLGSEAAMMHGAYGELITEPKGSFWLDNETGTFLGANATSTAAAIIVPFGRSFREFSVMMTSTDQQVGRSIIPYWDTVAGTSEVSTAGIRGENDDDDGNPVTLGGTAVVPGLVKGQQPGFSVLNYHSAPIPERIGSAISSSPGDGSRDYANAYNDKHGVPETPLFRSYPGDPVVFRVAIGASNQYHTFVIGGHEFPWEPYMWDDANDHRSQLLTARAMTAGETMDAELVGGAGGTTHSVGDFMYGDGREAFNRAGLWGIFRVLPFPFAGPTGSGSDPSGPVQLS